MKILLMTSMYPPIRTGSSFYAEDLASALARRGHAVTVLTLETNDAGADGRNVPVHRLPTFHLEYFFKKYFKHFRICALYPGNYGRVHDLVRRLAPDIILLTSHYHDIGFFAARFSSKYGIPLACTINTQLQLNHPLMRTVLRTLDRLVLGNLVMPFCSSIVSLDKEIERYLTETYRPSIVAKSVIIPYGSHGDASVLSRGPIPDEPFGQLVGIGHLIEQRNYLVSIRVFHELLKSFPRLTFKIIGHIYHDAAVRLVRELSIQDRVLFLGEMPHDTVLAEVSRSDLYMNIGSGRYAGLGTAALEAMQMGLPVVSNAPPDLFGDVRLEDMGMYVHADDRRPAEVAQKLASVLVDPTLRRAIGRNGQRFVNENLNWDSIARRMDDLCVRLCEAR